MENPDIITKRCGAPVEVGDPIIYGSNDFILRICHIQTIMEAPMDRVIVDRRIWRIAVTLGYVGVSHGPR